MLELVLPNLPPVTKMYIITSTVLMALVSLEIISPYSLYLNWRLILYRGEVWRLVTCFLFFGSFGMGFFWNMFILHQYLTSLEEVTFRSKSGEFLYMLIVGASLLFIFSSSLFIKGHTLFISGAMIDFMTYVWARRNSSARVMIIFFTVNASYLPYCLAGISLLIGGDIKDHILGILAGHIYYFFKDIYPLMPTSHGLDIFRTPWFLKKLDGTIY